MKKDKNKILFCLIFLLIIIFSGCNKSDKEENNKTNSESENSQISENLTEENDVNNSNSLTKECSKSGIRYTDIGDGTVRDNSTGMIWLKNANSFGPLSWEDAKNAVKNLKNGTHGLTDGSNEDDWRLPTIDEWAASFDSRYSGAISNAEGDGPWEECDTFVNVQVGFWYWSGTKSYDLIESAGLRGSGQIHAYPPTHKFYVWPVRHNNPAEIYPSKFEDQKDVEINKLITSNIISINDINKQTEISISGEGAQYSINQDIFTNSSGTVNKGDLIKVRIVSSSQYNTTVSASINIGGLIRKFNVTTKPHKNISDTTPDDFSFISQKDAALDSPYISNTIIVKGINDISTVSINGNGAEYSVNSGNYTSLPGSVKNGDTVKIKLFSSNKFNITTDAFLTIGGVTSKFSVTTKKADTTPDNFSFTIQKHVELKTECTSNTISVTGINDAAQISISGSDGKYSINGSQYISSPSFVNNGDIVNIKITSSSTYSSTALTQLTIGGVSSTFSVTTKTEPVNEDITPDPFEFITKSEVELNTYSISNPIIVKGITSEAPISISESNGMYSINGSIFTNSQKKVKNGDIVTVRVTSSSSEKTSVETKLNIGGVIGSFKVISGSKWKIISAGYYHSAGIKTDGSLYTWGSNHFGHLGNGNKNDKLFPTRIGESDWKFVSCGYSHTAAIKKDGSLYTWGLNDSGQLGNGTNIEKNVPFQIGTDTDWNLVSAGYDYTIAVKNDGSLYAWGRNNYGELGDGTTTNKLSPVKIGNDTDWEHVSAGHFHTTAIKNNGYLYSWGNNKTGCLGDNTLTDKYSPVKIGYSNNWNSVSSGYEYTAAVKDDGRLYTWGYNDSGQLGDGTVLYKKIPIQIGNENNWNNVSTGQSHTLAIKKDGSIYGWGKNSSGQTGDGTTDEKHKPVCIGNDFDWSSSSAGTNHSLALKKDGSLWSWGSNYSGVLGDGSSDDSSVPVKIRNINNPSQYFSDFTIQKNAPLNSIITSDSITIAGLNSPSAISISGANGKYSINGGVFTNSTGVINNGDTVCVKLTSSRFYNKTVAALLKIGEYAVDFHVTTKIESQDCSEQPEICGDNIDNNCDGLIDINCSRYMIRGKLLHQDILMHKLTNAEPKIWMRNEETGKVETNAIVTLNPQNSTYEITNLTNKTGISVSYWLTGETFTFPGNYRKWITVDEKNAGELNISLNKIIHLLEPWDNNKREFSSYDPYKIYTSPIRFEWENIHGAEYYTINIQKYRHRDHPLGFGHIESVVSKKTSDNFFTYTFQPSEENEYYEFTIYAYDSEGTIGQYMTTYTNGHGWDFRFRAD